MKKPKAEQLLENSARKYMLQWSQENFKRTHPRLHKSIIEAIENALNEKKECEETSLYVHDIRNKLSPITHLITILENEKYPLEELLPQALESAKRSVNYLAQRKVYENKTKD